MIKSKTLIATALLTAMIAGSGANIAFAQTSTTSAADLITRLQTQITALKTQLETLRSAQVAVKTSEGDVRSTLKLLGDMREGMTGNDVALLQTMLASDTAIYPEGMVTGYYGKATREAVKRFQKKHGLPITGFAGPMTRERLNWLLMTAPLAREYGDGKMNSSGSSTTSGSNKRENKNDGQLCINVPPGHLIAKGWKKHQEKRGGEEVYILPFCKTLPHGIEKKLDDDGDDEDDDDDHGSTTPPVVTDTTAPVASAIAVSGITNTGATITWTTNEASKSAIFLGTTSPVATVTASWTDVNYSTTHTATLSGLLPVTAYRFVVRSTDAANNVANSTEGAFTTLVTPDTTAPVISALSASATGSTTATVAWTTNESATTKVYYGTTTPVNKTTASVFENGTLVTAHSSALASLSASTTYYAIAESKDAANNSVSSSEFSWTTAQ